MMVLEPEPRPLQAVWPPKDYSRPQPASFFTRIPEADKTVAWPPRSESDSRSSSSCSGRGDPSQTVALKQQLPVSQEQVPVYHTQPVVTVLPRARGDLKWPPEECQASVPAAPGRIPTPKLSRKQQPHPEAELATVGDQNNLQRSRRAPPQPPARAAPEWVQPLRSLNREPRYHLLSRPGRREGFQGKELPKNYTGYRVAPGVLHMSPDAARYIADRGTEF